VIDHQERTLGSGEQVTIPRGAMHRWWNSGEGQVLARVRLEPALRFQEAILVLWGLCADGHANAKGMPSPGGTRRHDGNEVESLVGDKPVRVQIPPPTPSEQAKHDTLSPGSRQDEDDLDAGSKPSQKSEKGQVPPTLAWVGRPGEIPGQFGTPLS
jgi:hypothetical protein